MRGGERVLEQLCLLYPDADLYTLIHVPGSTSPTIEDRRITASPLSRLPGAAKHYRKLLPLFPLAAERFHLKGYDLVVSTSHAFAKGIRVAPPTPHLCYCFTPMRYVWDQIDAYLGRGALRRASSPLVAALRAWDRRTSQPERITQVIAISETVRDRVRRHWGREARVIFPPVDVERIRPDGRPPDDFYLMVGAFVPYKREDVAVEAFRELPGRLVVVGDGPDRAALAAGAPANVEFVGRVSDRRLAELYARCRALVYPQDEDFGIVAVEAQAAGRPVICLDRGGASETVLPHGGGDGRGPTGVWFSSQNPRALAQAIRYFEAAEKDFDPGAIRAWAEGFANVRFRRELAGAVDEVMAAARSGPSLREEQKDD